MPCLFLVSFSFLPHFSARCSPTLPFLPSCAGASFADHHRFSCAALSSLSGATIRRGLAADWRSHRRDGVQIWWSPVINYPAEPPQDQAKSSSGCQLGEPPTQYNSVQHKTRHVNHSNHVSRRSQAEHLGGSRGP